MIFADDTFIDVNKTDWYYNVIKILTDLKLINGYESGEFKPNSSIKANEFIKILLHIIDKVPSNLSGLSWDEPYIKMAESLKLNDKNIIEYNQDKLFSHYFTYFGSYYYNSEVKINKQKIIKNYNSAITREQVAAILANVFALNNIQNYKKQTDEYIGYYQNHPYYSSSMKEEIETAIYFRDLNIDKICYNPLQLREFKIDDKKFKYSRWSDYSFFSNSEKLYKYNKDTCFVGINDTEYRNTLKYIPYILKDFDKIDDIYVYDVIDMFLLGIMQGDSSKYYKPKSSITRAEAVSVLLRLMDESRRLPLGLNDSKSILFRNINNNLEDILYAPSIKGKPINELVDIYEIINKEKENTLGADIVSAAENGVYAYGFETQKSLDEYMNFEIDFDSNWLMFEHLNRLKNYEITIDFNDVNNKYSPYNITINSYLNLVEDKEFEGKVLEEKSDRYIIEYPKKFDEFFLKYHKDVFYSVYSYLFEDDVDVAWELLLKALVQERISLYSEKNMVTIEKVINDRFVIMNFNDYRIDISVSLKGNWK